MGKFFEFILRYGPLVAAAFFGLSYIPQFAALAQQVLAFLGLLGAVPDPALVGSGTDLVAALFLLVGAARKLWSLVKAYF